MRRLPLRCALIIQNGAKSYPFGCSGAKLRGEAGCAVKPTSRGFRAGEVSVALARGRREIFVELAVLALVLVGVGGGVLLAGDVRPFRRIGGVDLQPFLETGLGIGQDRLGRAFGLAD